MPRKGHTEEQILQTLGQAQGGQTVAEICRKRGSANRRFTPGRGSTPRWD